jgi:hypothetical protein
VPKFLSYLSFSIFSLLFFIRSFLNCYSTKDLDTQNLLKKNRRIH